MLLSRAAGRIGRPFRDRSTGLAAAASLARPWRLRGGSGPGTMRSRSDSDNKNWTPGTAVREQARTNTHARLALSAAYTCYTLYDGARAQHGGQLLAHVRWGGGRNRFILFTDRQTRRTGDVGCDCGGGGVVSEKYNTPDENV